VVFIPPSHFQSGPLSRDQGISEAVQSHGPHCHDRAGLVVAASPAQQPFEYLIPRACRGRQRAHPRYRYRCRGTQAFDRSMALPEDWRGADGHRSEGL